MSDILKGRGQIKVRRLESRIPFVGRIRNGFSQIAARWLIEDVVVQQNRFNASVGGVAAELTSQITALDKQVTSLTKQVAELETELKKLRNE